jgi:serine/threonine protein kinase
MIGTAVGSYRITAKIAEGGMGTVFRAEHTLIGRSAAIKILHAELSYNRNIVDRFFNEAKATTAIRHPGIVEVFEFGYLPSGAAFLVMELLEGEPLSRYLKRRGGRIPETEAAWLIRGMCSALAAAHAKSIVHRDLKPDNVFMVPDRESAMGVRPKLLDFGIAKLSGSEIASSKTRTGSVMGTPTYMSPEQCKGTGEVDHRADLYSLGCMLYELLCGRPPFVSEGAGELIGAHLFVAPDSPRVYSPQVSPAMEAMVLRLLAKNRDQRPANATELADHLGQIARATQPGPGPRIQTPVRGVPGVPPALAAVSAPHMESTQPMGTPAVGLDPRSRQAMAEEATVMEPLHVPTSGPMHAPSGPMVYPRPQEAWPHPMHPMNPMPTPPPPHMITPPPPMPMPTPTPQTVTTLSGATGVRPGGSGGRTRWPIAILVIMLFAAASAATTYLVVMRQDRQAAGGGNATPPTLPAPATAPPSGASLPAVTPDAAPAPVVVDAASAVAVDAAPAAATAVTPDPEPDKPRKKPETARPGSLIDLGEPPAKKPEKKPRKKPDKPPGPIELDI